MRKIAGEKSLLLPYRVARVIASSRNLLVHRYWRVDDERVYTETRENLRAVEWLREPWRRYAGMPRLSFLEVQKRRSVRLSRGERREAIMVLRDALLERDEVVLALVFGGILVEDKPIRDIDVAVYTGYRVSPSEWPDYVEELRGLLEKRLKEKLGLVKAVDVVLLEYAPPRLRAKILSKGVVIVDRSPGIRGILLLHALDELRALSRSRLAERSSS